MCRFLCMGAAGDGFFLAMSALERQLEEFDGVSVSILSEARVSNRDLPDFQSDLIRLCTDARPKVSDGATWIVKAEAEEGSKFASEIIDPLISKLTQLGGWQAQLHVCQSIEAFEISRHQAERIFNWGSTLTDHKRPFLRAWSLHVLVNIGLRFDEFREDSASALLSAENDHAASVRARARKLHQLLDTR